MLLVLSWKPSMGYIAWCSWCCCGWSVTLHFQSNENVCESGIFHCQFQLSWLLWCIFFDLSHSSSRSFFSHSTISPNNSSSASSSRGQRTCPSCRPSRFQDIFPTHYAAPFHLVHPLLYFPYSYFNPLFHIHAPCSHQWRRSGLPRTPCYQLCFVSIFFCLWLMALVLCGWDSLVGQSSLSTSLLSSGCTWACLGDIWLVQGLDEVVMSRAVWQYGGDIDA